MKKQKIIKNQLSNKGITLIALIITIIVLLILAGVTLAMVMGDSGIIKKAQIAKEITGKTEVIEDARIKLQEEQITNENLELTNEQIKNVLEDSKLFTNESIEGLDVEKISDEDYQKSVHMAVVGKDYIDITLYEILAGISTSKKEQASAPADPSVFPRADGKNFQYLVSEAGTKCGGGYDLYKKYNGVAIGAHAYVGTRKRSLWWACFGKYRTK